ncbi:Hypothetical predicted protein [Pelobates cultripes]|uniref:Uncharacterized protein n=1 Tax=Pelobates cultripes TaxID=61616 RepID=A0AAD1R3X4_PELCU|nr:Hypothetical predicted protein [Pelobates cultripes]
MTKFVPQAIYNLSHSITTAIMASSHAPGLTLPNTSDDKPMVPNSLKAPTMWAKIDRLHPFTIEEVVPTRKRATCRAKAVQTWKRAKTLTDSSDSGSDSEEVSDESAVIGSIYSDWVTRLY